MLSLKNDIDNCTETLKNGGTILYPTDTIWGIGCDATNKKAVEKIYNIKKRDEKKSMIILLANEYQLSKYCKTPNIFLKKILATTHDPLTIIYPAAKNLPSNLINEDGTIAIRIVKNLFCIDLLNFFGKPIVSTSANISGSPAALNFNEISEAIKNNVDYIVKNENTQKTSIASSILKWNGKEEIIKIR
ncbi:MAG: L-threonylcarbamoyladenylate synthase [Ferruginibacter sp.]|nr:threonylcarbamoyl-AMP synthase [Ferruginibacter sp.]